MVRQEYRHCEDRLDGVAGVRRGQVEPLDERFERLDVHGTVSEGDRGDVDVRRTRFRYPHIRVRGFRIHPHGSNRVDVPQFLEPMTAKSAPH
jgi:hypothetical protein